MADCPTDHELQAMLEQTLPSSALDAVEAHIADCGSCQQRMNDFTSAADLVVNTDHNDLSSIPDSVLAKLRETPHEKSSTLPDSSASDFHSEQRPQIPDFDIHEHIASGASGALYRATDRHLGRLVAVKVMHPSVARSDSARQRLQREARAVAAINHPHVVAVHSTGEDNQRRPYMVMELIDGLSIAERLQKHGPFLPKAAATLAEQAARGLDAAHASGLIHRDVKSSNILIESAADAAKVVDFGLVREDTQETQLTMDGMLAGTPAYISPEQIVNPTTVDARTDVYSLGIVLYEMLTGTVPFRGVVRMTLQQVQHVEPQPPRQLNDAIPRDLQTICLKAIEKTADRRYQSASDFGDDLQRFLNNKPIVARPAGFIEKSWRWCQRNPRVALLSALVGFAVLTSAGVTAAAGYRISLAGQEVHEADTAARQNEAALIVQRDAAMETVRKLVFEVPPMLQDLRDDTSDVEKSILKIALEGLDRVGQSAEVSGEVDFNTAHALQQLGFALYVAGEFEDSQTQLQRCLTLIDGMKAAGEPITVTAPLANEVYLTLSDIDVALGETDSELQHMQAAIQASREWVQQHPNDAEGAVSLAQSLRLLGEFQANEGESEHSRDAYREGRELLEAVLDRDPNHEDASYELDDLLASDELFRQDVRDPEAGRLKRILQAELKMAETQYANQREDEASRGALVSALLKFSRWHQIFGNLDKAESMCDRARSLFDETDIPPLTQLKIQWRLGEVYLEGVRAKPARNTFRDSLKFGESLLASDPDDGVLRDLVAFCRLGLADSYTLQSNGGKSETLYQQIVDSYSDSEPTAVEQRMLVLEAKIGLAWSAYYQDENAQAARLLNAVQPELKTFCSKLTADSESTSAFETAWIDEATSDVASLRDFLNELHPKSRDR